MRIQSLLVILASIAVTFEFSVDEDETQGKIVKVGAIFFKDEDDLELSFVETFRQINNLKYFDIQFVTIQRYLAEDDSLTLYELACKLISEGISAIFGPSSKASSDIVALIANSAGIPHIQFDSSQFVELDQIRRNHRMSINVAPTLNLLSKAYLDIVYGDFGWREFTIIYETDEGLARLQDVMKAFTVSMDTIKLRRISDYKEDYRVLFKETEEVFHETHIILDCEPEFVETVVLLAKEYDLFGPFRHWFFTHLDTHSSKLRWMYDESFKANITSVRIRNAVENIGRRKLHRTRYDDLMRNQTMYPVLMRDAVILFANSVRNVIAPLRDYREPRRQCETGYNENDRYLGEQIVEQMKTISEDDIEPPLKTENMVFNEYGQRIEFSLEIYKPTVNEPLAEWKPNEKIQPIRKRIDDDLGAPAVQDFSEERVMYKVVSHYEPPYFTRKPNHEEFHGAQKYEGYAVDLINRLSSELNFDFDFIVEQSNGKYDPVTKEWDGIMRKLIDHQAQIGICDITITQARREVVDFTAPFMQLGISILFYKSEPAPKDPFAFLEPFETELWLSMMLAMLIMTLLFVFIARVSYVEWRNPHMTLPDTEEVANKWQTFNSAWLMVGSIMQQGCDILPRGPPARILTGMWWFFAMMVVSTYTASLAAFLTKNKMQTAFSSLKDLTEQNEVKFGTMSGGSTSTFFSESNDTEYFKVWSQMKTFKPSVFTKTTQEGVQRVINDKGKYAFLMETTSILYNTERHPELTQVGGTIGEKHYALAVPLGAPYRSNLSVALLRLGERGELYNLKKKWWRTANDTKKTKVLEEDGEELSIIELGGVFVVLGVGVAFAIIIGIIEFFWNMRSVAVKEKVTPWVALKAELSFAWRIWLKRKPMRITEASGGKSASHSRRSSPSHAQSRRSRGRSSKGSSKSKST